MKKTLTISIIIFVSIFLIGTTLLTGCGGKMQAYEGSKLPTSEVAIIKPYSPFIAIEYTIKGATPATITKIDGKDIGFGNDKCEVLPGSHIISVQVPLIDSFTGTMILQPELDVYLIAEKGHVYTVYGSRGLGVARLWIVDDTTGKELARR